MFDLAVSFLVPVGLLLGRLLGLAGRTNTPLLEWYGVSAGLLRTWGRI